ncbi:hypothetical protein DFH07DRAFT_396269 [Mycena maculata]|uniref:Fungal N-terminal domain-containing protein n=1 Tax=Mycena maculata TaxID=230809 RepID=A0AAD7NIN2_9AGAR|nr:hypothetical protein DFH07DRAFT_396269 [Mycena maculata]
MAATLGTVTSILQLVDTALTARDYIQDFRHAPEERRTLLSEMEHLRPLLKELHDRIQSNQPSGQSSSYSSSIPQQMEKPLSDFQKTMEGFQQSLKPAGTLKDFSRRMKWPLWGKKESKEYLGKFEQFKSLLNGWLLLDIWDSGQQQRSDHQDILKSVEDAADEQRQAHDRMLSLAILFKSVAY